MSILPLLETKEAVIKQIHYITFMESRLFDQAIDVRVNVSQHILGQQAQVLKQWDNLLLNSIEKKQSRMNNVMNK